MSDSLQEQMDVPISAERLLAALLKKTGSIEIGIDDLLGDYSNFQISVAQEQEGSVIFELVEADEES
jgi:hypothetical protein